MADNVDSLGLGGGDGGGAILHTFVTSYLAVSFLFMPATAGDYIGLSVYSLISTCHLVRGAHDDPFVVH